MADERTWYLGPVGDLRGLISPDDGVERTVDRYGGVHQSLSGARTMDITGHRATYKLQIPAVTPNESRFLEALHYRTVPGPYRLLDPMSRNRLSRDAALIKPFTRDVTITSGALARSTAGGPAVGVPVSASVWSSYTAGASLTLPPVPVLAGETLTVSVWLATAAGASSVTVRMNAAVTSAAGGAVQTGQSTVTVTGQWQRATGTLTMPDQAAQVQLSVTVTSGTSQLWTAAAQIETAATAGTWDLGGGAPAVLLDQLERSSPIYPLNDLTATLLEV